MTIDKKTTRMDASVVDYLSEGLVTAAQVSKDLEQKVAEMAASMVVCVIGDKGDRRIVSMTKVADLEYLGADLLSLQKANGNRTHHVFCASIDTLEELYDLMYGDHLD